jgi:transposase-like protein
MKKQRKHYTPEEKVAILKRHLLEQVPISELCDKQGLQPTVFYRWQKKFFENGASAFEQKRPPGVRRRSTPRGIGSWRSRENSVRFGGSRLREKARALVSGQFRVTDEVYYCRGVSSRSSSASECWSLDIIRELPGARRRGAW